MYVCGLNPNSFGWDGGLAAILHFSLSSIKRVLGGSQWEWSR